MASDTPPAANPAGAAAGSEAAPAGGAQPAAPHPIPFALLNTGAGTSWDPASANVTLNVRLDGCICPSEASPEGARISYSHAVVLDEFIPDSVRHQLLQFLLHGDDSTGSQANGAVGSAPTEHHHQQQQPDQQQHQEQQQTGQQGGPEGPRQQPLPAARWERRTTDMAGAAPTWGVRQHVLRELASGRLPVMQEVHARLARLYPECDIAHLPSEAIQLAPGEAQAAAAQPHQQQQQQQQPDEQRQQQPGQGPGQEQQQQQRGQGPGPEQQQQQDDPAVDAARPSKRSRTADGGGTSSGAGGASSSVDCACFVANAAVAGDTFRYHVDADPTSFPDGSPWHAAYGDYFNGEPGRPLLASLLLYLNEEWRREWGADTLFLDGQTDTGIFVAPRPCRAVLFDQDIMHRVSAPSPAAGSQPRFSLVWKLALLPRLPGQALCLARPEWGPPVSFGSAARVDAVKRQLAAEQRQQQQQQRQQRQQDQG
ncbi:hypothetical protein ABPG75_011786 [Micractinium tetrahymenae]